MIYVCLSMDESGQWTERRATAPPKTDSKCQTKFEFMMVSDT